MRLWFVVVVGVLVAACRTPAPIASTASPQPRLATASPLVFPRITVIGASLSAGFRGPALARVVRRAAGGASVSDHASSFLFRDPVANGHAEVEAALVERPSLVFAIDFLFWHAYQASSRARRLAQIERGLADLAALDDAGATLVVGDVPRITTASEALIPASAVPSSDDVAAVNTRIRAWAAERQRVLVVPFAAWTEPLTTAASIELTPGERVAPKVLMTADGLHPNALGVWFLMTKVDHEMEARLATPIDALVFRRPPP